MIITYLFLIIFLLLIGYFAYFQFCKRDTTINSSYNSRLDLYAEHVIRGDILDRNGEVLATSTVNTDGTETRSYPYSNVFAHVVGYVCNGKGGIESLSNYNLLQSHEFILVRIFHDLTDQKNDGDDVVTTLDANLQQTAYDALGYNNGAVVVLEPSTGKILAMVSKPDFDPNTLSQYWDSYISDDSNSVLLNRATSGTYPPGSIFKIFTTLEYVHENEDYDLYSYLCNGSLTVGDETVHCYHNTAHGEESLMDSFAHSCNSSYANIGLGLDADSFYKLTAKMLFNKKLPANVGTTQKSTFSLSAEDSTGTVMRTAIGQGNTTVTPLHMAMIAAAIDNNGTLMKPYLIDHTQTASGLRVHTYRSSEYGSIMSESDAVLLQRYMEGVVSYGTATALSGQNYSAAGKTGSAEYDSQGNSHGWFIGYASKEGMEDIAIAVIVEDGDSGSASAVPVAQQIFQAYFNE